MTGLNFVDILPFSVLTVMNKRIREGAGFFNLVGWV